MKGHAIFELTNTETGEKRVYEDDNMVTNFLEQFCIPTGQLSYDLLALLAVGDITSGNYGINGNLLSYFTGGLLLFEDEVDEDADNIWPRNGNKVIGQAGSGSYSGANLKAGSYNETESGPVENGYRHVWDFTTNQANGQISCACLTTRSGGILGNGNSQIFSDFTENPTYLSMERVYDGSNSQNLYRPHQFNSLCNCPLLIDYNKNAIYSLMGYCSSYVAQSEEFIANQSILYKKEIRIRKEHLPITELSIFDDNPLYSGAKTNSKFEDLVFPMPQEVIDSCDYNNIFTVANLKNSSLNMEVWMNTWGSHIYLYFTTTATTLSNMNLTSSTIAVGKDLVIVDIDVDAETCNAFTVRNTTGSTITYSTRKNKYSDHAIDSNFAVTDVSHCRTYNKVQAPIFVTDKYVIMHTDDGKLYRISRADNTDVKEFCYEDNEDAKFDFGKNYENASANPRIIPLGKNIEQFNRNRALGYVSKNNGTLFMLDIENAKYGILSFSSNPSNFVRPVKVLGADLFCVNNSSSSSTFLTTSFPTMLTTINNLDSPVLKTSADTMKVTYIMTNGDV